MTQPMTSLEFVADIMTFSRYGALAQAFVMNALSQHAALIMQMSPETLRANFGDHPMIGADAWQGLAQEIHAKLKAHSVP